MAIQQLCLPSAIQNTGVVWSVAIMKVAGGRNCNQSHYSQSLGPEEAGLATNPQQGRLNGNSDQQRLITWGHIRKNNK